jgi:hypothetical protein
MKNRKLGRSGISIAPLVLGGNVFGWTADEPTSFAILDRFVDPDFNAIDTSIRLLLRICAGQCRRRVGNHHRQMVETSRPSQRCGDHDKGGNVGAT